MKKDPVTGNRWSDTTTRTYSFGEGISETHRWGPLEIRDKLGQGGFGTVYRAWDPRLQREVALKLLDAPQMGASKQRETILREGRLLARVRHPNVATVHGVAEHEGIVGLWMELVRGKSLEELLKNNGPFGCRESIGIGVELASALRAVHNAGVIHGDISTKNVIREEGGRIVLVDLGLGGPRAELSGGNTPWTVAGTPVYMAPEMLRGERPSVRTEIYAMGVLLYRLCTREYPSQQARHPEEPEDERPAELLRDRRSDIPEAFCGLVERALAPNPADRFQSMGELQVALEKCWTSGGAEVSGAARKGRFTWAVSGAVLIALLVVAAYLLWPADPRVPEGSKILLADIENHTRDVQLDGVTALLRSQLSQVAYFDLLDRSVIKEVLQRMARPPETRLTAQVAREAAWREGIDLVVGGDLASLGNSYVLNLHVEKASEDPEAPETTWTNSFRAKDKNAVFDVIDESVAWIRNVVAQASTNSGPKTLPSREATTASWEALDSFSRAEEHQERGKADDAVLLLQEAVRIDPDFALAHMRIGDILVSLGRHREGYEAWQKALHTVKSRRLTRREELRIAGLYSYDTNDFEAAEKTFRTFCLQYPNDYHPYFLHAFALRAEGRYEEAIQELEQAAEKRATLFYIPAQLARTWMLMGRIDRAQQEVARLRALKQPEWALVLEASCMFLQGRYQEAETGLRQLIASEDPKWKSEGYGSLAYMLGELGRFREALQVLETGIRHDSRPEMASRKADKLIAKAYLAYRLGDSASCKRSCLEAVALEAGPLRLGRVAGLLAQIGAVEDAEQLGKRIDAGAGPVWRLARHRIEGEVYLARKQYAQALVSMRRAEQLEPYYATKEYLARALGASGRKTEALDQYRIIQKAPATFWQVPQAEFPGQWADSLLQCSEIAESLNRTAIAKEAREVYRQLRSQPVTRLTRE